MKADERNLKLNYLSIRDIIRSSPYQRTLQDVPKDLDLESLLTNLAKMSEALDIHQVPKSTALGAKCNDKPTAVHIPAESNPHPSVQDSVEWHRQSPQTEKSHRGKNRRNIRSAPPVKTTFRQSEKNKQLSGPSLATSLSITSSEKVSLKKTQVPIRKGNRHK